MNKEIKRIVIEEEHYSEIEYPFTIKQKFLTLASIIEITTQKTINTFVPLNSIPDLLGFNKTTIFEVYNLSPNPVDILFFDNIFLERDIAQGRIYKGRRFRIFHNWTMIVHPCYKDVKTFTGGITWYMMESKDIISTLCFRLKNEINQLVPFNGQSRTFRLSIKEI